MSYCCIFWLIPKSHRTRNRLWVMSVPLIIFQAGEPASIKMDNFFAGAHYFYFAVTAPLYGDVGSVTGINQINLRQVTILYMRLELAGFSLTY